MGIVQLKISNYKSIRKIDIKLNENGIVCLLGMNGTGKTTIISAIKYLYDLAESPFNIQRVIDKKNPYIQKMSIEILLDFGKLERNPHISKYVEKEIAVFDEFRKGNHLPIRLTQYKDGTITWWPVNNQKKIRALFRCFPVYFINTRNIVLSDWSSLWNVVSDISISSMTKKDEEVKDTLSKVYSNIYGDKYRRIYDIIDMVFKEENINVDASGFRAKYQNMIKTNFGGDIFMVEQEPVDFFSDGMSSLKYIRLFTKLVNDLSKEVWKDVLVILDEPEIGLHPQYVDKMVEHISKCDNINFIISSHSSHMVGGILREKRSSIFYKIYQKNKYTCVERLSHNVSEENNLLMGDEEAVTYFAEAILFVEGKTEVQLFHNESILKLFPKLKNITIYNTEARDDKTRLILPKRKQNCSYINLIDMDKILQYDTSRHQFKIHSGNKTVNPLIDERLKEKEKMLFSRSKRDTLIRYRKKIKDLLTNTYEMDQWKIGIHDNGFIHLSNNVKAFCKEYSTLVFRNTIEGAIVCKESYSLIWQWIHSTNYNFDNKIKLLQYQDEIDAHPYKEIVLRCILGGKTDYLLNYRAKSGKVANADDRTCKIIDDAKIAKKTNGWIRGFFEWYEDMHLDSSGENGRLEFRKAFPELYDILQNVSNLV